MPARADERPPALDDQLEDAVEVGLAAERARDRGRRLEPADGALELVAALLERLVEPRVLDRDRRPSSARITTASSSASVNGAPPSFSVR